MPKDSLQVYAATELYKRKWRYNTENNIWFIKIELSNQENSSSENIKSNSSSNNLINTNLTEKELNKEDYNYFNTNEWKEMRYVFGYLNTSKFVTENEIVKYTNFLNINS